MNVTKTQGKPPRILIYGPQKIGKSSFAAMADRPVFVQAEDGLDALGVSAFPLSKSFAEIMTNLEELAEQDHDFKTVVIDSLDWMEPLLWQHLIKEQPFGDKGKKILSIEDYGYGKGYAFALDIWRDYLAVLDYLRDARGMTIIQIAHAMIRKFENPETDIYDRYELKLHKHASALMMEHSDIILFANHYVGIKKEEKGMSKEGRKRAVGTGARVLYTEERPAFMAGNRYSLPSEIPFDKDGACWGTIAEAVPFFSKGED
ncbi:ATP-binding protein [Candidatus Pacearchaeota archaeon]|nr:ATP-binding protein [Candidatus Pacearchaeota archaeon]